MGGRLHSLVAAALAAASIMAAPAARPQDFAAERAAMVETIRSYEPLAGDILGPDGFSPTVLDVMGRIERHLFVPEDRRDEAYADTPLPIGHGQTISQPFIVALTTELMEVEPDDVVLEIGTGSGYQAAVLAPLAARVCTVEIIPELGAAAARRLAELGFANVEARVGDGYDGWPDCGPFDAIAVTAAADHVPPPLVAQLKPGGRMVIPVGGVFATQYLLLVEKDAGGAVRTRQLLPVRFVPLTRGG
jgi:protein-L-isoaspartate(D-aspartate) O-methyltransferase